MGNPKIRVMSIMAHQDDFEFNAGGAFALIRERCGGEAGFKILAASRGAGGHHIMSRESTFRRREKEAARSAKIISAEYECLKGLDGNHQAGCVLIDNNMLGGLWNAIRRFNPHYIFCPPVVSDPLAGIHVDHLNTAWAVRMVAYLITVPHAFPVMGAPGKEKILNPAIINVDDTYSGGRGWHVSLDIGPVYDKYKVPMSLCHESQVFEWLPWNDGKQPPDEAQFRRIFRGRHTDANTRYGLDDVVPREYFCLTNWGRKISSADLDTLFPDAELSRAGREFLK